MCRSVGQFAGEEGAGEGGQASPSNSKPRSLGPAHPASRAEPGQGAGTCFHRKSHGQQPREERLGKKGAKFTQNSHILHRVREWEDCP